MRSIAAICAVIVLVAPLSASTSLHILDSIDKAGIDCGCTFFNFNPDLEAELYVAGREVLFFDLTSAPPRALVNFGRGNLELYLEESSSLPIKSCKTGEPFLSRWKLDSLTISAKLKVSVADGPICWFGGELSVSSSEGVGPTIISGACQC